MRCTDLSSIERAKSATRKPTNNKALSEPQLTERDDTALPSSPARNPLASDTEKYNPAPSDSASVAPSVFETFIKHAEMSPEEVDAWVRNEHRQRHCDSAGHIVKPVNFKYLQPKLDTLSLQVRELVSKSLARYCSKADPDQITLLTRTRLDKELAESLVSYADAEGLSALARTECSKYRSIDTYKRERASKDSGSDCQQTG